MRNATVALFIATALGLAGCADHSGTDTRVGDRPPPAAPVTPMQSQPGINHESNGPAQTPATALPKPAPM